MSEQLHRAIGRIEGKLDGIAEALAARNARDDARDENVGKRLGRQNGRPAELRLCTRHRLDLGPKALLRNRCLDQLKRIAFARDTARGAKTGPSRPLPSTNAAPERSGDAQNANSAHCSGRKTDETPRIGRDNFRRAGSD
jgi:hypothetical protein